MAVICKRCGGPHPVWECKREPVVQDRPASLSRPDQVAILPKPTDGAMEVPTMRQGGKGDADKPFKRPASRTNASGRRNPTEDGVATSSSDTHADNRKDATGLVVARFNKVAYQRDYMRKRRAKQKEGK